MGDRVHEKKRRTSATLRPHYVCSDAPLFRQPGQCGAAETLVLRKQSY